MARFGVDAVTGDRDVCPYGLFGCARCPPPPISTFDRSGSGPSAAHFARATIVRATRASDSEVFSMRSSRRKMSALGRPCEVQEARNFVTFEVRTKPSSRASTREMDPGRYLLTSLRKSREDVSHVCQSPSRIYASDRENIKRISTHMQSTYPSLKASAKIFFSLSSPAALTPPAGTPASRLT